MDALGEKLSVKVVVWAEDVSSHFSERVEISAGMCEVSYETHSNRDSFLESLVSEDADIALVSMSQSDWRNTILDIPSIRTDLPVYLFGEKSANGERENFAEGIRIIYDMASKHSPLPLLIDAAIQAKKVQHDFRNEKEGLIRQLFDLRDEQERTERQAADIVEMAENLEFSKKSLEKLNAEKDKLFSVIAHDLKSPFTSILGYTELLATTSDTLKEDQIRKYSENTHAAASNVFRLIQTLLEWARLQIGRVDYEPERLNIREIMTEIMDVYANIASRKSISVTLPDRDGWVFADRGMTETILRNLINNAIKFTHRGGLIELIIDETDSEVLVSVKDNGVGMSPAQVEIFNEQCLFDGADGTAGESGTGLGLSISKEMIEKNGGTITVQSQEGLGKTFSFSLERSTP